MLSCTLCKLLKISSLYHHPALANAPFSLVSLCVCKEKFTQWVVNVSGVKYIQNDQTLSTIDIPFL